AEKLAASATSSNGQMCTCPGLIFTVRSSRAAGFIDALKAAFDKLGGGEMTMLTPGTLRNLERRRGEVRAVSGIRLIAGDDGGASAAGVGIHARATLYATDSRTFLENPTLTEECFGPCSIVIECDGETDLVACLERIRGTLT